MVRISAEPCPSRASSISTAPEGVSNNMVSEALNASEIKSSPGILLDLKLGNDGISQRDSKIEVLNLFSPMNPTSSHTNESSDLETSRERRSDHAKKLVTCNFCKREFSTSQALEGHQNAHKHERFLAKKRQRIDVNCFSPPHFPYYPYLNFSSHPFYGSLNRSPLGVRLESMIRKPSYPWTLSSGYGLSCGWPRQAMMNATYRPSNSERLMMSNGGFGMSGIATGAPRRFGDISPANNVAVNRPATSDYLRPRNPSGSDHKDASEIDLSLKL